jgi:predicted 3-demethylubiquinone-9 3-methyltransferase (glyoxalase superfamily)
MTVSQTIRPFLMFQGQAEAATMFYVSLFPESQIHELRRYGPEGPGAEGSVQIAHVSIGGQRIFCSDIAGPHGFSFTPAVSLFVTCASDDEIERLALALAQDGQVLMPLGDHGFSRRFTWINDRFGVSWQLNLD